MPAIRRAAVAGAWYPGQAGELEAAVDAHLAAADAGAVASRPIAVVVPHAGLKYSGGVGACAFAAASRFRYRAIVLVGPSHFVPFRGVSIWPKGSWDSPLGPVAVDADLSAAILAQSSLVEERPEAHRREHSLEMQLPFIARLMPGVPIVPLVMGHQTRETSMELGRALAEGIGGWRAPAAAGSESADALLVASSDLSHYLDARDAEALDRVVLEHVEAFDPEGLMTALEREPRHACGGGPVVAVLGAARALGASHASVLRYADSGDVSGDKSSVVGYMSAAMW
jgi:AmmeMemoRadiSam system protein B